MSKLMTDSKTLTDLLKPGLDIDDNLLSTHIDALKQAAFDCMEIQVSGHVMTEEELKKKAETITETAPEAEETVTEAVEEAAAEVAETAETAEAEESGAES